ncbi:MAG: hypothetical protein UY96_C0003G0091 [Parcubacteria group bacterium GW2011_GWB1_56_8]|nr:MAG: hypothetical protein UY96_C0003G0091 [Parcubacteria group bacterium GW2011_GWB1_56_8]
MQGVALDLSQGDLQRIVALPRRPVLNCERGADRQWAPEAQALITKMTAQFSRGQRLSCACRDRYIEVIGNGSIRVFHTSRPGLPPPPPVEMSIDSFCLDGLHDPKTNKIVQALRPGMTATLAGLGHPVCLTTLNPVQSWILDELPKAGGIFGMISVGGGKTIAGILAPLAVKCKTAGILAKPDQRLHYYRAYLQLREHFRVPSLIFDKSEVESFVVTGSPAVHFIPYSLLSNKKSTLLLEQLNLDMLVDDECHLLASLNSSRSMRWVRYLEQNNGKIVCNWSGSTVKKTVKDVAHLSAHSLGMGSPYPLKSDTVEAVALVIDPSPVPDTNSSTARALRNAFGDPSLNDKPKFFVSGMPDVREGYKQRVIETCGVISTKTSSVTCSISINERKAPPMPETVKAALAEVRGAWVRPDGEELVEAMEQLKCAREVASGFYDYWAYPKMEPVEVIEEWFAKRKLWNKELRVKIMRGEPHLDSPALCENAAERAWRTPPYDGDLPKWFSETWRDWAKVKNTVQPDPRSKWIDDYLARDAAQWAKENRGIVWCQSRAFGKKVAELAGLPYHAGGIDAEAAILAEDGSRSVIASMRAHGTGRDGLQYKFYKQLIAEPPSSADIWEQCLDAQTEVLTNKGWVGIDDSIGQARVAAYEIRDGSIRWQRCKRRVERRLGSESMWGIKNAHLDIRVTADHRMICKPYKFKGGSWKYGLNQFVEAENMPLKGVIPISGMQSNKGVDLTDYELLFIGLFMTDGNYSHNNLTVSVFQSERYPSMVSRCEEIVRGCDFKFRHQLYTRPSNFGKRKYPLHKWCISSGRGTKMHGLGWWKLRDYLNKDLSPLLERVSSRQLRLLLEGMWIGDGSKTVGTYDYFPSTTSICTARKVVADKIQALCVRHGLRCNVATYKQKRHKPIYKLYISEQCYWSFCRRASDARPVWQKLPSRSDERVWCVSVDTGAIVTRRNGKVAIVGNCLGRLVREGQEAETVETEVYIHVSENRDAIRKALRLAEFIEATTPNRQLILAADVGFSV